MDIWERIGNDIFISDGSNKETTLFEFDGIWGVHSSIPNKMLNTIILNTEDEKNIEFVLNSFNVPTQIFASKKSHSVLEKFITTHNLLFNRSFPIVAGNKTESVPDVEDVNIVLAKTKKHYEEIIKVYSKRYEINEDHSKVLFNEDFFYHSNCYSFLAYYKNIPVCALILTIYEKLAAVINLALDPEYKKMNIAKFLTSKAISFKEEYEVLAYYAMALYEESAGLGKFLNAKEIQLGHYWEIKGDKQW
jgi:hypothetical protein